jgi:transcriptional regulator with XRE-family HTH domain
MRQEDLAARLKVSAQAVGALERREAEESVTIASLRQAADALDAELYYVLLPRQPLETRLEAEIDRVARFMVGQVHHSMRMEDPETGLPELLERIREVKDQLRLTPSLLWTLPNDV